MDLDLVGLRTCQVIAPVTACSLYVVALIRVLELNVNQTISIFDKAWYHLGLPYGDDKFTTALFNNTIIVALFILLIAVVTLVILFVFYMEWHCCLSYYFYLPSFIIMALLTPAYLRQVLMAVNWFGLDIYTVLFLNWNFTVLGMMAIFGLYAVAPLYLQQLYLVHNAAILSMLIINVLPGWAPWMLLGFLVIWDLFAVLAPFGPLKLLISMAEKEGVIDMPGLIYTTDAAPVAEVEDESPKRASKEVIKKMVEKTEDDEEVNGSSWLPVDTIESDATPEPQPNVSMKETNNVGRAGSVAERRPHRRSIEEKGVNMGLGDFIFYSLLVGLASKGSQSEGFYTALASLNAILVGLIVTLLVLAMTQRALPALPVSVALGLVVAPMTMYYVPNFCDQLAAGQIFI